MLKLKLFSTTPIAPSVKIADYGFAFSFSGWVAMHAAQISLLIQWGAGLAVMVSGFAAAYYHIKAGRKLK
jgi:hypothetical protein